MGYLGYFSISFEKIMFYTEILTRKVELWIFSLVSLVKKTPQNNFSSQNFSVENNYCSSSVTHVIVSPEENIKIGHGIRVYSYFHLFKPPCHDITSSREKSKKLESNLAVKYWEKYSVFLCCEKLKFHLFKKRSQTVIYYILGGE